MRDFWAHMVVTLVQTLLYDLSEPCNQTMLKLTPIRLFQNHYLTPSFDIAPVSQAERSKHLQHRVCKYSPLFYSP